MWADDALWLPLALARRRFRGRFVFDGSEMLDHEIEELGVELPAPERSGRLIARETHEPVRPRERRPGATMWVIVGKRERWAKGSTCGQHNES